MRRAAVPVTVLVVEVGFYLRYAQFGAQFHFWLHGLFGAVLSIGAVTLLRVLRPASAPRPWGPGLGGHLYSAFPDVLFLTGGILHATWMDVFAVHVSLHLISSPLLTMWAVFTLTLTGYVMAEFGRQRSAVALLGVAVTVMAIALALRDPIPGTLEDVRSDPGIASCARWPGRRCAEVAPRQLTAPGSSLFRGGADLRSQVGDERSDLG